MRVVGTLAGLAFAGAIAAALPIALEALPRARDLEVYAPDERTAVMLGAPGAALPAFVVRPSSLAPRLAPQPPVATRPGLEWLAWSVTYGRRWEREVAMPVLTGPFVREGEDTCGLRAQLGAGLFDAKAIGASLREAVHARVAPYFPFAVDLLVGELKFPALAKTDVGVVLEPGAARVKVKLTLADGQIISAAVPVKIVSRDGTPSLQPAGPVQTDWQSQTRTDIQNLAGLVFDKQQVTRFISRLAADEIAPRVREALKQASLGLDKLRAPWVPLPGRPRDEVKLRMAADAVITPAGVELPLCANVKLAAPVRDAAVPGFVKNAATAPLAFSAIAPTASVIRLLADADAVNLLLYVAWQSGTLKRLGESTGLVDSLPRELRQLAFDVTGFDPGLPPTVDTDPAHARPGELPVRLANVHVGTWDARSVVAHARAGVSVASAGDQLAFTLVPRSLAANCVEQAPSGAKLTPCVGDLLPMARESALHAPVSTSLAGGDLLSRLPRFAFQGVALDLSRVSAAAFGAPPRLEVRLEAGLVGE